jgi:hypothetical protein
MAIHAIGVTRYGWKHRPDGSSLCRHWFMVLYLPIVPLRRWLVVSENERPTGFLSGLSFGLGLSGSIEVYEEDNVRYLEPAPGSEDIIWTYLWFWGAFLAIVGFMVGLIPFFTWLKEAQLASETTLAWGLAPAMGLLFGLPIGFALMAHQYSFGIRPTTRLVDLGHAGDGAFAADIDLVLAERRYRLRWIGDERGVHRFSIDPAAADDVASALLAGSARLDGTGRIIPSGYFTGTLANDRVVVLRDRRPRPSLLARIVGRRRVR